MSGRALVLALVLMLALGAAGCNDGNGVTFETAEQRVGVDLAAPAVTAPLSVLDHPQTIVPATSTLNAPTAVLPVPHYSAFDVSQKYGEFIEGSLFVGTSNGTEGSIRLIQSGATVAGVSLNRVFWPVTTTATIRPVTGLALDILEYDGAAAGVAVYPNPANPDLSQRVIKGRLWATTGAPGLGSAIHIFAGRADASFRPAVELAVLTPTAIPAGEHLAAIAAGPSNLTIYAASQSRIWRYTPADVVAQSREEIFADVPATDGQSIFGLASDGTGRLYIGRRDAAGAFSFRKVESAPLSAAGVVPEPFALTGGGLTTPTAIAVNSADHLVVAERATGFFYEFDQAGVLVTRTAALATTFTIPSPPTVVTAEPPVAELGPDQLVAFACDPYISRIVYLTRGSAGNTTLRAMANVTLRGGIIPIIENRCTFCHSTTAPLGGLDLSGPATIIRSRLLLQACESLFPGDRPADCPPLPTQNQFFDASAPSPPLTRDDVVPTANAVCSVCPMPPRPRVAPGSPAASYLVQKLLANQQSPLNVFPADPSAPSFTNNCASDDDGSLEAGEVCGERMPLASFVQRPMRRAEVEMVEAWIRRGAKDD